MLADNQANVTHDFRFCEAKNGILATRAEKNIRFRLQIRILFANFAF